MSIRSNHLFLVLTILCSCLCSSPLYAKTIFLHPQGNDNNVGNMSAPLQSISKAATIAVAGDEVMLMAGTYRITRPQIIATSGTSSKPITYQPYNKAEVTLDASGLKNPDDYAINVTASHIKISGMRFTQSSAGGINITAGTGLAIENNHFSKMEGSAISAGQQGMSVEDVTISGNHISKNVNAAIAIIHAKAVTLSENYIYNNFAEAMHLQHVAESVIDKNKFDNNKRAHIRLSATKGIKIINNEISRSYGIMIGNISASNADEKTANLHIANNVMYDTIKAIDVQQTLLNASIQHNILWNTTSSLLSVDAPQSGSHEKIHFKRNIFKTSTTYVDAASLLQAVTFANNCWDNAAPLPSAARINNNISTKITLVNDALPASAPNNIASKNNNCASLNAGTQGFAPLNLSDDTNTTNSLVTPPIIIGTTEKNAEKTKISAPSTTDAIGKAADTLVKDMADSVLEAMFDVSATTKTQQKESALLSKTQAKDTSKSLQMAKLADNCTRILSTFGFGVTPALFKSYCTKTDLSELKTYVTKQATTKPKLPDTLVGQPDTKSYIARYGKLEKLKRQEGKPRPELAFATEVVRKETARRIHANATAPNQFAERMLHFWSNHFNISRDKNSISRLLIGAMEREAIRTHMYGNFADMLIAVTQHPAMISYLDNDRSVGMHSVIGMKNPSRGLNENLAREVLELHTLGVNGGYTQQDVAELAKVMSGWTWTVDALGFSIAPEGHEPGKKTVLGRSFFTEKSLKVPYIKQQGEEVLRYIAARPATARFIATKLLRHYIQDEPTAKMVDTVSNAYIKSGGNLTAVYNALVSLPESFDDTFNKYPMPYDILLGTMRMHETGVNGVLDNPETGNQLWNAMLRMSEYSLWAWETPDGWPDIASYWRTPQQIIRTIEWCPSFIQSDIKVKSIPLDVITKNFGEAISADYAPLITGNSATTQREKLSTLCAIQILRNR
jgi:uncharacterized protein (DUF1800 family)